LIGSVSSGNPSDPDTTFTLANFRELLRAPDTWGLILRTLWIGLGTTALTMAIGVPLAWIIVRTDVPLRGVLEQALIVPFFVSPFIGAIAWSLLAAPRAGLLNALMTWLVPVFGEAGPLNIHSSGGIIWTMGLYFVPFVFIFVGGALKSMDPSLEDGSQMCGAGALETARRVTLPLVMPAISGSALLVFILAVGQLGVPALLGTPGRVHVLTTEMYILISNYPPQYGQAAAMGVVLFLVTAALVYLQHRLLGAKQFVTVTGKGFRPRHLQMGRWRAPLLLVCLTYLFVSVVLPLAALVWVSFISYLVPSFSHATYTLRNYAEILLTYPVTKLAIKNSLVLSLLGATGGMILMSAIAWILLRTRIPGRKLLEYVCTLPIAVPAVVLAVGFLWAWINVPFLYGSIWLLLICYVTVYMPYGISTTSATLRQIDPSLEECATVCGASPLSVLTTVTIPLLKPGLVAGWVLLFIMFNRELATSLFLATSQSVVMSVAIFDLYYQGLWGRLSAFAILQVLIVFAVLALGRWLGARGGILLRPISG
jgi:iron(III) transport system permease protein